MEASISNVYEQAVEETTARLNSYMEQYEEENRVMRARLLEGEITEAEYEQWARRNLLRTQQYSTTIDSLTEMLVNADSAAIALVNGELPYVVAESYNFTQFVGHIIADHDDIPNVSFEIYNAQSVQAIIRDNPEILPVVDPELDTEWNRTRLNREITQGIIQGSTIPDMATRLQRVTQMDRNSAIRAARTAMTGAENMGRNESHRRITSQGIDMVKRWSATYDARTRDTHRLLDDTTANAQGLFGDGILDKLGEPLMEYPGDPKGAAAEIYNCRCRLNVVPPNYSREANAQAYERWMQENYPADYNALNESNYFDRLHKTDNWTAEAQQRVDRRIERRNERKVVDIPPMTEQNMFDGLNPSETDKHGKTDIDSISADGNKVAVVLDRQMLITRYDSLGQPQYYVGVGNNEGIAIERWQVSAESHTAEGKQYHAHVVILDRNNFEQRVSIPPLVTQFSKWETYTHEYDDGGIPTLNFEDYLKLARHQSNADGYLYGMGKVWGYDDDDNPHHFRPTFRYSQYSSWGEERERERRREQARRRRRR